MKVLKFGGMTLETTDRIKSAALIVQQELKSEKNLIVVVSAMGRTTNDLIALANKVSSHPPTRELDMLLSVGERISMSLMSIALHDLGISCVSLTGSQAGILTTEEHSDAQILEVKPTRLIEELQKKQVIIVAGFQGVSSVKKEITTLGRGGSDITAAAFAAHFQCPCVILKEVPGIMSADPQIVPDAFVITEMDYKTFIDITKHGAKVVNSRAAEFAAKSNVIVDVQKAISDSTNAPNNRIDSAQKTRVHPQGRLQKHEFILSSMKQTETQSLLRVTGKLSEAFAKEILKSYPSATKDQYGISLILSTELLHQAVRNIHNFGLKSQ